MLHINAVFSFVYISTTPLYCKKSNKICKLQEKLSCTRMKILVGNQNIQANKTHSRGNTCKITYSVTEQGNTLFASARYTGDNKNLLNFKPHSKTILPGRS